VSVLRCKTGTFVEQNKLYCIAKQVLLQYKTIIIVLYLYFSLQTVAAVFDS